MKLGKPRFISNNKNQQLSVAGGGKYTEVWQQYIFGWKGIVLLSPFLYAVSTIVVQTKGINNMGHTRVAVPAQVAVAQVFVPCQGSVKCSTVEVTTLEVTIRLNLASLYTLQNVPLNY